jgi:hypothetical protein
VLFTFTEQLDPTSNFIGWLKVIAPEKLVTEDPEESLLSITLKVVELDVRGPDSEAYDTLLVPVFGSLRK